MRITALLTLLALFFSEIPATGQEDDGPRRHGVEGLLLMQSTIAPHSGFLPPGGTGLDPSNNSPGDNPGGGAWDGSQGNTSGGGSDLSRGSWGSPSSSGGTSGSQGNSNAGPIDPNALPGQSYMTRSGEAALVTDGTGKAAAGEGKMHQNDTWMHNKDGSALNTDTQKFVVVNRQDYGNVPKGTKVLVTDQQTGNQTIAFAGDRGPQQNRSEASRATLRDLGIGTTGNSVNGNHKLTFQFLKS